MGSGRWIVVFAVVLVISAFGRAQEEAKKEEVKDVTEGAPAHTGSTLLQAVGTLLEASVPKEVTKETPPKKSDVQEGPVPEIPIQEVFSSKSSDGECTEVSDLDGVRFACIEKNLTKVPESMDPEVVTLEFGNNRLTELSTNVFPVKLEKLRTFAAEHNKISTVDGSVFEKIPNVEILDLRGNSLKEIDDAFSAATHLKELNLHGNDGMTTLRLPRLESLKTLDLSDCKLTEVAENAFENLTHLVRLDLANNNLNVSGEMFAPLANLKSLTLSTKESEDLLRSICTSVPHLESICLGECDPKADHSCWVPEIVKADDDFPLVVPEDLPKTDDTLVRTAANQDTKSVNDTDDGISEVLEDSDLLDANSTFVNGTLTITEEEPLNVESLHEEERKREEDEAKNMLKSGDEESVPATSKAGVGTRGVNGTAIGIIIGIVAVMAIGIIVKKNWGKIKRKWESRDGRAPPRGAGERKSGGRPTPEEMPLKSAVSQDDHPA